MLEQIKNNILKPFQEKQYAIVGVILRDTPIYNVLIVDKKSDALSVETSFSTEDFNVVKDKVNTSVPLLLNFYGKGIINKQVSAKGNYLKEVLFNASIDDFYIYELHQNQQNFISIVRKDVLEKFFALFLENKYLVVDYSIGPFVGVLFKGLSNTSSIISADYELSFENDYLIETQKLDTITKEYILGEEKINNIQVPLFSTLLHYLYPSDDFSYDAEFLKENKKENVLKKAFNTVATVLGIFFLSALLISYLLLNYYNDKYVSYESQLYNLNDTYNQVKKLENEKENKTKILQESGILNQNFLSFYMYRIVNSIPDNVGLNSLKVNPAQKKIKNFEKIIFETNTIIINGNSSSSMPINSWVKELKKENWISKIEILDFSKSRNKKSEFTLKIIVK
ncbi:Tfp pilus assembly protein PilN [Aquimarina sp. EL_43]|uniref:PilN domain-containing protein n=1 Tax=unclassified Aquimarina TaxID=2627091 RepID=UPI0018C9FA45|nr:MULTISPECIES: PilN domain-containing protein [unclassified Aquimarina]MBG6130626.1 Tfp pilus assembly protein PilN [Aquimarina sp. EL_35]MBG6151228.1 Tfp pilus assembly protein PilN [Aquimarina sp. EL_32]MBG6169028.1 Tfp pilus assembly protein PilN [Aquimarina sp. EL_43]